MGIHHASRKGRVYTGRWFPALGLALVLSLAGVSAAEESEPEADAELTDDEAVEDVQAERPEAGSVPALIAELNDDDYETREAATQQLMRHDSLSQSQLGKALAEADTPETKHRLRRVAMHRYYERLNPIDAPLDRGQGGLGVDLSEQGMERVLDPEHFDDLDRPAILLTKTVPGFPAYAHLRSGDMIVGIDGNRFNSELTVSRFRERLTDYTAGEEMTLHVVRNGEEQDVTLTLDNVARIDSVHRVYSSLREPGLYRPFVEHLRELLPDDARVTVLEVGSPE